MSAPLSRRHPWRMPVLLTLAVHAGAAAAQAEAPESEVWQGIASSFSMPLHQFLDGTAQESLNLRLAADLPLDSGAASGPGLRSQGEAPSSPTLRLGLRYVPLTYWFADLNLIKYLRPGQQQPWNPDFTYSFGYDDWHPYTLSLVYSNHGGNRLDPDRTRGERVTRFDEGTWSLGFKFPMPEPLAPLFLIRERDSIGCQTSFNYARRYTDARAGERLHDKRSLALGCRYSFDNGWHFDFKLLSYPVGRQKQPWDPDFTYGFGYFDWRPGTVSLQYANHSGNRFPGNPRSPGTGRLRDGSLTLSWNTNLL